MTLKKRRCRYCPNKFWPTRASNYLCLDCQCNPYRQVRYADRKRLYRRSNKVHGRTTTLKVEPSRSSETENKIPTKTKSLYKRTTAGSRDTGGNGKKSIRTMRKISRKGLVKKLDKLVSQLVVERDGLCVTCGSKKTLGAGHLFSRIAYSTRWDLMNVYAQCWPCNFKHEHDPYPLTNYFIEIWGRQKLEDLHKRYVTPVKYKDFQLKELYESLKGGE